MAGLTRVVFCGAVDDGKSTIMGRLLVETESATLDEMQAAGLRDSGDDSAGDDGDNDNGDNGDNGGVHGGVQGDFSRLVDGLESERGQGITIDVAHRHLTLKSGRRVLLLDSPGHAQYTRNMAVATSSAEIAVLVIDAVRGVREQTLRHALIAQLMGVRDFIVLVNKLDAIPNPREVFDQLKNDFNRRTATKNIAEFLRPNPARFHFIGVSGLRGDNIVRSSKSFPADTWTTLHEALEALTEEGKSGEGRDLADPALFMPVQHVIRDDDQRWYSGYSVSSLPQQGQGIQVLPSMERARIAEVRPVGNGGAPTTRSALIRLDRELDVARGDVIVDDSPETASLLNQAFSADLICLSPAGLQFGMTYLLKCGPVEVPCHIDISTFRSSSEGADLASDTELQVNDVARVEVTTTHAIALQRFDDSPQAGGFILIDRSTGETIAVGMVRSRLARKSSVTRHQFSTSRTQRELMTGVAGRCLWFTGLPASGKSTIADAVQAELFSQGITSFVLDGDTVRQTLSEDLGFSRDDRAENVRRVGRMAQLLVDSAAIVLVTLVSPSAAERKKTRDFFKPGDFVEIFVDTPIEICKERDPKGLYAQAANDESVQLTGVQAAYEAPTDAELVIDGSAPLADSVARIVQLAVSAVK